MVVQRIVLLSFLVTLVAAFRAIDLSTFQSGSSGFTILGGTANAKAGQVLNSAGDFNHDGISDLMIAAPNEAALGETDSGAIYVLFGKAGASPFSTIQLSAFTTGATTGFRIFGGHAGDILSNMAGLGDFNGDGIDDIAVAAQFADPLGRSNAGTVYVIYGRTSSIADISLLSFTTATTNGFMIHGEQDGDSLGYRLNAVGDFNGDGYNDVLVSCEHADFAHSAAYVVFGSHTRTTNLDLSALTANTDGFRVAVHPGTTEIFTVGDVNNDGFDDIGIADYSATYYYRNNCGILTIIFGHSTATAFPDLTLSAITSGPSAVRVIGAFAHTALGTSAGAGGDFNNDGLNDFVAGDEFRVYAIFGRTGVSSYEDIDLRYYLSDNATAGQMFTCDAAAVWYCGNAGDVDGDGISDIYVSAPEYQGNTGIVFVASGHGSERNTSDIILDDGFTYGIALQVTGSAIGGLLGLGTAVAGADYNHDGAPDLLIGAATADSNSLTDSGAAYVIYGVAAPVTQPTSQPSSQPSTQPSINPATLQAILASPTYKVRNGFAFAAVGAGGKVSAWGEAQYGGNASAVQSQLQSGIAAVVGSRFAFAAVTTGGSLTLWGANISATGLARYGSLMYSVGSLVANEAAFAGVDRLTGRVVAVGSKHHGGNVLDDAYCNGYATQLSAGVRSITASAGAFAAIKTDGTLLCWGSKHAGADVSAGVLSALVGAKLVAATMSAFAVLLSDNTVASWGDPFVGGDFSAVAGQLREVHHLTASRSCFVAFKKSSSVVVWGYGKHCGDTSAVSAALSSHVTYVAHTFKAMAALKADGTVVAWGEADSGGNAAAVQADLHDVSCIYGNGKAFAALTSAGGVVAWGRVDFGGSIPAGKVSALSCGVVSIAHTSRAFAALKSDESVVVWGQAGHGGEPGATVEALLTSGVHTICANDVAFSAIKTDGNVVAWGHSVSVPVAGIQFTSSSLAAGAQCA